MRVKRHKGLKRVLLISAIALVAIIIGSTLYVQDYYRADPQAASVFSQPEHSGVTVSVNGNLTLLSPEQPNGMGFILYPGGKVEETAYLPLLEKLCKRGVTCALVKMPFRLAVLGVNRADAAKAIPGISEWFIGGHSLGGAMASGYASAHAERFSGLVLLAAYPTKPATVPTLALYGSEDKILNREKLSIVEDVRVIPGGNHAGFGNYGEQSGDGSATISNDEQQEIAAEAIMGFMAAQADAGRSYR